MTRDEMLRLQADVCHLKSAVIMLAKRTGQLDAMLDLFENRMEAAHAGAIASPTMDDEFLDALSVTRELMLTMIRTARDA